MLSALKKRYSNLGLSDELLNKVVPMCILGLPDDADDAVIESRAGESFVSDMLKELQSQSDKIRTLESKVKDKKDNKGDDPKDPPTGDSRLDEVLSLLKSQKEANEALQSRLEALEKVDKAKERDSLISKIANELNMQPAMLDLCKGGLSSDLDEQGIRDALGAAQKKFIELGVNVEEGTLERKTAQAAKEEAERKDAAEWVKEHEIK